MCESAAIDERFVRARSGALIFRCLIIIACAIARRRENLKTPARYSSGTLANARVRTFFLLLHQPPPPLFPSIFMRPSFFQINLCSRQPPSVRHIFPQPHHTHTHTLATFSSLGHRAPNKTHSRRQGRYTCRHRISLLSCLLSAVSLSYVRILCICIYICCSRVCVRLYACNVVVVFLAHRHAVVATATGSSHHRHQHQPPRHQSIVLRWRPTFTEHEIARVRNKCACDTPGTPLRICATRTGARIVHKMQQHNRQQRQQRDTISTHEEGGAERTCARL